jgi:hypothetical protein
MARVEGEFKKAIGLSDRFKMTIAEMIMAE